MPQTSGRLLLETKEGHNETELQAGRSYFRNVGVEHNVVNINDFEFAFVEIELRL